MPMFNYSRSNGENDNAASRKSRNINKSGYSYNKRFEDSGEIAANDINILDLTESYSFERIRASTNRKIKIALTVSLVILLFVLSLTLIMAGYKAIRLMPSMDKPRKSPEQATYWQIWETRGQIIGDISYVRSQPDMNGIIVSQLNRDEIAQIKGKTENGWYRVTLKDGRPGFVFGALIRPEKIGGFSIGLARCNRVKIRENCNFSSKIIRVAYKNEKLLILRKTKEWYRVLLPEGREGFVYYKCINKIY